MLATVQIFLHNKNGEDWISTSLARGIRNRISSNPSTSVMCVESAFDLLVDDWLTAYHALQTEVLSRERWKAIHLCGLRARLTQ